MTTTTSLPCHTQSWTVAAFEAATSCAALHDPCMAAANAARSAMVAACDRASSQVPADDIVIRRETKAATIAMARTVAEPSSWSASMRCRPLARSTIDAPFPWHHNSVPEGNREATEDSTGYLKVAVHRHRHALGGRRDGDGRLRVRRR